MWMQVQECGSVCKKETMIYVWKLHSKTHYTVYSFWDLFILCVREFCLYVCLYNHYVPCACRGQKMVLDPLEVGLPIVMSHHVGTGNQTR